MKHAEFRSGSVAVRAAVALALGGFAMWGQTAYAAEDTLEEVQVTGSRIVRKDFVANSPLVTVDSSTLEQKSGLNIESYLNQLPEFNPAAAPTVKGGSGGNTDVQISAVNSVGIASVSLRGFGPNRNLVLMDGHRATPTNALMVVDINGIPSSMIKRVEIISGGASATYGADAIGGVSNFILRKDFQGLEVDSQYGITAVGDNREIRASAIAGTKVADNRGHIVFATEYYNREAAFEKNRDFYTRGWADPTVGGNFLGFVMGLNGWNPFTLGYNVATLDALINQPANTGVVSWSTTGLGTGGYRVSGTATNSVKFNPNSSLFIGIGNNAATFGLPIDGQRYKLVNTYDTTLCTSPVVSACAAGPQLIQQVTYNEIEGYASSPQTRYSFMGSADYDITDRIKFFTSGHFAQSETATFLAGTNASLGWEATIPFNPAVDSPVDPTKDYTVAANVAAALAGQLNNPGFIATGKAGAQHPVPANLAMLLLSRGAVGSANQSAGWIMETFPLGSFDRRRTVDINQAWEIEAGLRFDMPFKDWKGELYYSRGESSTYNVAFGNNSLQRWRTVVTSADYGRMLAFQGNGTAAPGQTITRDGKVYNLVGTYPGANNFFGTTAMPCTSGYYDTIFKGDAAPSRDCQYIVEAPLQTRTQNQQDITELNLQGGLFNLPAGEVRTALGFQQRRNAAQFNPDILQSTAAITDQVIGLYPTGYLDAQTSVKDYYAEALIPVVKDLPFLKRVELEVGGRYSDYAVQDATTTYKINANIQFNDYLRLRGGYNRANRSPNLGELYLNLQQVFTGGGAYGDPCGLISNSPFGAGGAAPNIGSDSSNRPAVLAAGQTAAGAQSAYLICQAQMGTTAANYFYRNPLVNQPGSGGGGFAWVNQTGNPNLKNEIADTYTAGFVFQSPFEAAALRRLSATVDWYQISIADAILPYSVTYAQWLCYGKDLVADAAAAAAKANSAECQLTPRNLSTGGQLNQQISYANQATVKTSGVDFTVNWFSNLSDLGLEKIPGGIGVNVSGTWLQSYKTKTSPAKYDPVIDWKGSLGPTLTGFNAGAYSYRVFTSFSYSLPSFSVNLRWRHLPQVNVAGQATQDAIVANNAAVAAGDTSKMLLSYTPITNLPVPSYDIFDLSANWTLNDHFSVRAGVDNLLDKDPAISGATTGYPVGTTLSGVCNGAPGCVNPTSYSLGTTGQGSTSGGYYDVLGRRYFLGFKAKF